MISAEIQPAAKNTKSVKACYLELLEASSVSELEERIVTALMNSIQNVNGRAVPVRLSKIAPQFSIEPKPEYISGAHDGEIQFDAAKKSFVIKLCLKGNVDDRVRRARERFTYAHEMAHRFFFIKHERNGWIRAIDVLTSELSEVESMKARRNLYAVEEPLCNRIAQRVLMPDSTLKNLCSLTTWWTQKEDFYRRLWKTSQLFEVSRECLLVGISNGIRREVLHPPEGMCLMVIGRNAGPMTNRGKEALRVSIAVFPSELGGWSVDDPFPGFEVGRFGVEAEKYFSDAFFDSSALEGQLDVPVTLSTSRTPKTPINVRLRGWWRSLGSPQDKTSRKRLFVWGTLDLPPI